MRQPDPNHIIVSARIPRTEADAIDRLASLRGVSRSSVVRVALLDAVQRAERELPPSVRRP